ncbi:mitochondrial 37S ribosomal protein MRP4 [Cladophialophora carrionii]|uniref:Mitochondrial 37S ribosomal protein MRP4 n=1 Tax=Cladophialophora carrionii TaxID=86049 RepID=A0A1C1CGG3_9EURO|nr:mitochondrial 37S ribosomal protein MRP4 [Cladophialophora carrionii]
MIIRQFCARHGRTVLAISSRGLKRAYATSISDDNPIFRPSERDPKGTTRIPGHPDDVSSILDTVDRASTPATRILEDMINSQQEEISSLRADVNAHAAARPPASKSISTTTSPANTPDPLPFRSLKDLNRHRRSIQKAHRGGTHLSQTYDPSTILRRPPTADDLTLPVLLANQTHLGHHTSLWNPSNSGYIFGIRDEIHIISLDITYAYLKRAAKVVQAVAERGGIILFIGTRDGMEEIIVNSAKLAEGYHIFHRWVPGSLTNGQQILGNAAVKVVDVHDNELTRYNDLLSRGNHQVMRPDLVICLNPIENQVCLHECGVFNVPTIGVIDTDANPTWVTYPIPANDDSFRSIALIGGVLGNAGKEGQRLRKLKAAASGEATYDTSLVNGKLRALEEMAALDVDNSNGADADAK